MFNVIHPAISKSPAFVVLVIFTCLILNVAWPGSVFAQDDRHGEQVDVVVPFEQESSDDDARAPADELPSVEDVIARYHETVGGVERLEELRSTTSRAKIEITGMMERQGILTNTWSRPNQIHMSTAYRDAGTHVAASDGKLHWIVSELTGNRIVDGSESQLTRTMNNPLRYLQRDQFYDFVQVESQEEYAGVACFKLELIPTGGTVQNHYFAVETGCLMGMEYSVETPYQYTVATQYDDFRDVDGMLMPFHISQSYSMEMEAKIDYLSREINADVDPALFEIPPEIVCLLENEPPQNFAVPLIELEPQEPDVWLNEDEEQSGKDADGEDADGEDSL